MNGSISPICVFVCVPLEWFKPEYPFGFYSQIFDTNAQDKHRRTHTHTHARRHSHLPLEMLINKIYFYRLIDYFFPFRFFFIISFQESEGEKRTKITIINYYTHLYLNRF